MQTAPGSTTNATRMVAASYLALAAVVWFNNSIGAILPEIEDEIGGWAAAIYPLVPGAVMMLWSLVIVIRQRTGGEPNRVAAIIVGSLGLAAAVVAMGVTKWAWISALGVALAAFASAYVVRALTSVLKSVSGPDVERVLMRGNAYASVASVAAPLAIAASIAIGIGWLPGMLVPIGAGAVAIALVARHASVPSAPVTAAEAAALVPAFKRWWREFAGLTLAIVVEFCFVFFAATYLHEELGLSKAAAAAGAAAWGIGMAIGRFVISTRTAPRTVIPSVIVISVGLAVLLATDRGAIGIAGIGVAGLGAAPLYPSRLAELLHKFPDAPDDGAARGLLASGTAVLIAPALIAGLRSLSDVRTAFFVVPILLVALVLVTRQRQRQPQS